MIDQRNAGASVTPAGVETYTVDRFSYIGTLASKFTFQQNAGGGTAPTGFTNYLGLTATTAVASPAAGDQFALYHKIEGFNCADLGFGSANASPVTVSFWVRSSLTGTFAGGLVNSAGTRSYVFNYTINSANTWEYKTITIAGDTTGTWLTTNAAGIQLRLDLGSGSNQEGTASSWQAGDKMRTSGAVRVVSTLNAYLWVTGVQLEKGSTATSFDYRPYGTELALCQRYYEICPYDIISTTGGQTGQPYYKMTPFKQTKRASPTMAYVSVGVGNFAGSPVTNSVDTYGVTWKDTTPSNGGPNVSWYSVASWTSSAEL
jgi:hypothetical protein